MWLQNPENAPGVGTGMSLGGGEGFVGERNRDGAGAHINDLGPMSSSVLYSMLRTCLFTE